jgi:hypothetical protein
MIPLADGGSLLEGDLSCGAVDSLHFIQGIVSVLLLEDVRRRSRSAGLHIMFHYDYKL